MLKRRPLGASGGRGQRGLSLVELMVGVAVGLFVVAAATMLVTTQLSDNRRLLLETQLQQDLRAAADILTRQIRRTGYWEDAAQSVGTPDAPAVVNPYFDPAQFVVGAGTVDEIRYSSPTGETGPYGFRLNVNVKGTALQTRLAGAGWQDLTDRRTLQVTSFTVTPRNSPGLTLACTQPCPDGSKACWPRLTVRALEVAIEGQAVGDPAVRRNLTTVVRLRNDWVPTLTCP